MSDGGEPTLSIVTVLWNHKDDIAEYLAAVEAARDECKYPIELVLVDNGSTDGTPEMLDHHDEWVKVVRNPTNEGFAVGCNVGLQECTGEFLMLLNPDAKAVGKSLEAMVDFLRKHSRAGGVGCQLLHDDGLPQQSAFAELSPLSYLTNHSMFYPLVERLKKSAYQLGIAKPTKPFSVDWLQGSCVVVPRRVYEAVGGLEPSFFIYCEDTDWCHRIRKAGYSIVHMPNVQMPHKQKGSVKRRPEFCFRRVYRSIVHYTNRQFSGRKRDAILTTVLWDMKLRVPAYRMRAYIQPAHREALGERLSSVRQLIDIVKARDPDLYDDPTPR